MRLNIRSARMGLGRSNSLVINTRSTGNWGSDPVPKAKVSKPEPVKVKPKEREPDWS